MCMKENVLLAHQNVSKVPNLQHSSSNPHLYGVLNSFNQGPHGAPFVSIVIVDLYIDYVILLRSVMVKSLEERAAFSNAQSHQWDWRQGCCHLTALVSQGAVSAPVQPDPSAPCLQKP